MVTSNCLQHEFDLDITKYLTYDLILETAITKSFTFDLILGTESTDAPGHQKIKLHPSCEGY